MADISAEITAFKNAAYGEDVRDSMISLANKLNNVANRDEQIVNSNEALISASAFYDYDLIPRPIRYGNPLIDHDNMSNKLMGYFYFYQSGLKNTNANARCFIIPIDKRYNTIVSEQNMVHVCFCDSFTNITDGPTSLNGYISGSLTTPNAAIDIPTNAKFMVISGTTSTFNIVYGPSFTDEYLTAPESITDDLYSLQKAFSTLYRNVILADHLNTNVIDFNTKNYFSGGYITNSGEIASNPSWSIIWIPIPVGVTNITTYTKNQLHIGFVKRYIDCTKLQIGDTIPISKKVSPQASDMQNELIPNGFSGILLSLPSNQFDYKTWAVYYDSVDKQHAKTSLSYNSLYDRPQLIPVMKTDNLFNYLDTESYYGHKYINTNGSTGTNQQYNFYNIMIELDQTQQHIKLSRDFSRILFLNTNPGSLQYILSYNIQIDNSSIDASYADVTGVLVIPNTSKYCIAVQEESRISSSMISYGQEAKAYISPIVMSKAFVSGLQGDAYSTLTVGDGKQYSTITEACSDAQDGDTILVYPGVYTEAVDIRDKYIHIIGYQRDRTILQYSGADYVNPPLEITHGMVENLTIKSLAYEGSAVNGTEAYCVHIDMGEEANNALQFFNCVFESWAAPTIGIGLRENFHLSFLDCQFIKHKNYRAIFYCHEGHQNDLTGQRLEIINCNFYYDGPTKIIGIQLQENTNLSGQEATAYFYNNTLFSESGWDDRGAIYCAPFPGSAQIAEPHNNYLNSNVWHLDPRSTKNNIELMNAY